MQGASLVVPAAISLPLVLLVAIAMLIAQLGWAILGGLVVLVLFLPYNASVCKRPGGEGVFFWEGGRGCFVFWPVLRLFVNF